MEITEVSEINLYVTGRVIVFIDGRKKLVRDKLKLEPSKTDDYYTVKKGDMFDEIAYRYYNKFVLRAETCWWMITDMNKVKNPLFMEPFIGKEILIPNIQRVLLSLQ